MWAWGSVCDGEQWSGVGVGVGGVEGEYGYGGILSNFGLSKTTNHQKTTGITFGFCWLGILSLVTFNCKL